MVAPSYSAARSNLAKEMGLGSGGRVNRRLSARARPSPNNGGRIRDRALNRQETDAP
jgi:hypothetical protein